MICSFPRLAALMACLALLACQPTLPPEDEAPPVDPESGDVPIYTITVERAYTLEDPRDEDFRLRIAAEAASACGSAGHRVLKTRPYGPEGIGDEFLYRLYQVQIACTG